MHPKRSPSLIFSIIQFQVYEISIVISFRPKLFRFCYFSDTWGFFSYFLLLLLPSLWPENVFCIIWDPLNVLMHALLCLWSVLANVPSILGKNIHPSAVIGSILCVSFRFNFVKLICLLVYSISVFCVLVLLLRGVHEKFPNMFVVVFISFYSY